MKKLFTYEKKHQPLLPWSKFSRRIAQNFIVTLLTITLTLILGIVGYGGICGLSSIDALLNASMILSGMGPVGDMESLCSSCKLFMSFYALFSGLVFVSNISLLMAPIAHRLYHRFHLIEK